MSAEGPLGLVVEITQILDLLEIPYAIGGSIASSFFGEPEPRPTSTSPST